MSEPTPDNHGHDNEHGHDKVSAAIDAAYPEARAYPYIELYNAAAIGFNIGRAAPGSAAGAAAAEDVERLARQLERFGDDWNAMAVWLAGAPGRAAPEPLHREMEWSDADPVGAPEGVSGPEQGAAGEWAARIAEQFIGSGNEERDDCARAIATALRARQNALVAEIVAALRSAPPTQEGT